MNQIELRPIPGFPGYQASADGFIWSTRSKSGGGEGSAPLHRVAQRLSRLGYYRVNLCIDNKRATRSVHVLVLLAFGGPRPEGMVACHNNGIRTDCRAENLRWGTRLENAADMRQHGTVMAGESHRRAKLSLDQVKSIRDERAKNGTTYRELAAKYSISESAIGHVVSRRQWKECAS